MTRRVKFLLALLGVVVIGSLALEHAAEAVNPAVATNGIKFTRLSTDVCPGSGATCLRANSGGDLIENLDGHLRYVVAVSPSPSTNGYVATWDNTNKVWYAAVGGGGGSPTIGNPVSGATGNKLLYTDGSGNLQEGPGYSSNNVSIDNSGITTSESTDGLELRSTMVTSAGTPQSNSPSLLLQSQAFDTGALADTSVRFRFDNVPTSANPPTGDLKFKFKLGSNAPIQLADLTSAGVLTVTGSVNVPSVGTDGSNQHALPSGTGAVCTTDSAQTITALKTFNSGDLAATSATLTTPTLTGVVYGRHAVADAAYSITSTDLIVAYTSITATRIATLPSAVTAGAGHVVYVGDESGSVTQSILINVQSSSGTVDSVAAGTGVNISVPRCFAEYESDGTNWHTISGKHCYPPTWTDITPTNSWTNSGGGYANLGYTEDANGVVHIRGKVQGGTSATSVGTIPAAARPGHDMNVTVAFNSGAGLAVQAVVISASAGTITPISAGNTWIDLDGLSYVAGQ